MRFRLQYNNNVFKAVLTIKLAKEDTDEVHAIVPFGYSLNVAAHLSEIHFLMLNKKDSKED